MESEQTDPKPLTSVTYSTDGLTNGVGGKTTPPTTNIEPRPKPYQYLLGFAIFYAVGMFLCPLGVRDSMAPLFPLAAGVYSTVLLVALWSVFGPGNYLQRLFWAHLIGAIPAIGLAIGVAVVSIDPWSEVVEIGSALLIPLISVVPISLSAQLPYWFFRSLFGWQLVYRGQRPERSFNLRDIFVLTFLFAFCFAVPQMSVSLRSRANRLDQFDLDEPMVVTEMVVQPDGRSTPVERVLTRKDVAARQREQRRQDQLVSYAMFGQSLVVVIGISLLSVPMVLLLFGPKETASGCGLTVLYVTGVWIVIFVTAAAAFGGPPGEVFLYFGVLLASCACAVAIPLMVARETGLQLTSPKRFAREQLKS